MPSSHFQCAGFLAGAAVLLLGACAGDTAVRASTASAGPSKLSAEQAGGLHNLFRVTPGIYSGSMPETADDFAHLRALGVRTVISVDGSTPKVGLARGAGLRYVHIPIEYSAVTPSQTAAIARAIRDLPGPVYVHCHHCKHLGPSAAACASVAIGKLTTEQAVAFLGEAGTTPGYQGLWRSVRESRTLDTSTIDGAPGTFPEVAPLPGFVRSMAEAQDIVDMLRDSQAAGWKSPPGHPDFVAVAEAGRLEGLFRGLVAGERTRSKPEEFRSMMARAHEATVAFEATLGTERTVAGSPDGAYKALTGACAACHERYRDNTP